jgi:hypothetical protein
MPIKEDKDLWTQLMELKALTENTGAIHELQVFQLKAWAGMLFEGSTEIQIVVNPKALITFCNKNEPYPDLNALNGLARSIKDVLGGYFSFEVKNAQNEVIFTSSGNKKKKRKLSEVMERLKKEDAQK